MFKVTFSNSKLTAFCSFGTCSSIEEAVSLAMAVHRSSNVPHYIEVIGPDDSYVISFSLIDKSKK